MSKLKIQLFFFFVFTLASLPGFAGMPSSQPFTTDFTQNLQTTLLTSGLRSDESKITCRPLFADTPRTKTWFMTSDSSIQFYYFKNGKWLPGLSIEEEKALNKKLTDFKVDKKLLDANLKGEEERLRDEALLAKNKKLSLSEPTQASGKFSLSENEKREINLEFTLRRKELYMHELMRPYFEKIEINLDKPDLSASVDEIEMVLQEGKTQKEVASVVVLGRPGTGRCPPIELKQIGGDKRLVLTDKSNESTDAMGIEYFDGKKLINKTEVSHSRFVKGIAQGSNHVVDLSKNKTWLKDRSGSLTEKEH